MRTVILAAILLAALPALGASKKKGGHAAGESSQPTPPPVDPALKDAAMTAKGLFITRVEMCMPPQHCDAETLQVVDEAEKRYVRSCRACATDLKKCDEDRDTIRAGKGSRSYNPCD